MIWTPKRKRLAFLVRYYGDGVLLLTMLTCNFATFFDGTMRINVEPSAWLQIVASILIGGFGLSCLEEWLDFRRQFSQLIKKGGEA